MHEFGFKVCVQFIYAYSSYKKITYTSPLNVYNVFKLHNYHYNIRRLEVGIFTLIFLIFKQTMIARFFTFTPQEK